MACAWSPGGEKSLASWKGMGWGSGDGFAVGEGVDEGGARADGGEGALGLRAADDFVEDGEGAPAGLAVVGVAGDGEGGVGCDVLVVVGEASDGVLFIEVDLEWPEESARAAGFAEFAFDIEQVLGGDAGGHQEVFVGEEAPAVGHGDVAGLDVAGAEGAVDDAVDGVSGLVEGGGEGFAEKDGEVIGFAFADDRLGGGGNDAGEIPGGLVEVGFAGFEDGGVEGDGRAHECGFGGGAEESAALGVEFEFDASAVETVVGGLGAEGFADHPGRLVLVGVAGDEDVHIGRLGQEFPERVGVVVGFFPTHVGEDDDGLGPCGAGVAGGVAEGGCGIGGGEGSEGFRGEPSGQAGGGESDEGDLDSCDFADGPRGGGSGGFAIFGEVGADDGGFGFGEAFGGDIGAPVEIVVAGDPGIVSELVEQADHEGTFAEVAGGGALEEVTGIDEERVRVGGAPGADLGHAAGESADIGLAGVAGGGEDVAVEVGGVDEGYCAGGRGVFAEAGERAREPCAGAGEERTAGERGGWHECRMQGFPFLASDSAVTGSGWIN